MTPVSPHRTRRAVRGNRKVLDADYLKKIAVLGTAYFGGGLLESGGGAGGVAVPLLSGGGVVFGLVWSEGVAGMVLGFDVESLGAAGAVVVESVAGALGDVDCCLEHAATASALRHNNRILRFMVHLFFSVHRVKHPGPIGHGVDNVPSQDPFHRSVLGAGKLEPTACMPVALLSFRTPGEGGVAQFDARGHNRMGQVSAARNTHERGPGPHP